MKEGRWAKASGIGGEGRKVERERERGRGSVIWKVMREVWGGGESRKEKSLEGNEI